LKKKDNSIKGGQKMSTLEKKNFNQPDNTQNIGRLKVESITMGTLNFARETAAPGWRWSEDVKPVAKTESCQVDHLIYIISGRLHVRMDDGKEEEFNPGDMVSIPPGHDGWTVGDQPLVWLELPH
jgi:ethanolamine utilization protein EutQ (cupin superfamily)